MLFLFDQNIPVLRVSIPSAMTRSIRVVGESPTDTEIWNYARQQDAVIITKDSDFSDRIMLSDPPPRVVHLRFGNLRRRDYLQHLARVWPDIEALVVNYKLIDIYHDRIETVA